MLFSSAFLLLYLAGLLNPFGTYFMIRNLFFPLFLFKMTHFVQLYENLNINLLCCIFVFSPVSWILCQKWPYKKSNLLNYSQLMNFLRQIYFSPIYTMTPVPSMTFVCRLHFRPGESEHDFRAWWGRELLSGVFLEKHQERRTDLSTLLFLVSFCHWRFKKSGKTICVHYHHVCICPSKVFLNVCSILQISGIMWIFIGFTYWCLADI